MKIPQELKELSKRDLVRLVLFLEEKIDYDKIYESIQGSFAYMEHADAYLLKKKLVKRSSVLLIKFLNNKAITGYISIYQ